MQYNIDFEIASVLVMTVILLHFICIRQFPSDKTRIFGMLLLTCIAESIFNILSCIGLANSALVPVAVNELLAFAFFIFEGLASYLLFRYFMAVCELEGKSRRVIKILGATPFALFLILLLTNPFTGFFFYFADGSYYQGFGAAFGYFYIAYYFAFDCVMVVLRRSVVDMRTKLIVAIYAVVAVVMIGIQYRVRGVLLTSVSNALVLLMVYMSMQNPRELIDIITSVGNEHAFRLQLKTMLEHKNEAHVITVHLTKFQHIHTILGIENSNNLLRKVAAFLHQIAGDGCVFRSSADSFALLVPVGKSKEIQSQIKERFEQDWEVQENHVMLPLNMVIQHYPQDFNSVSDFLGKNQFLLEQAVTEGNGAVVEMNTGLVRKYIRRTKVEMAMMRAIREKSFEVYYQPIYSIAENRIVSLEALVRLNDAEIGLVPPDEFIPLAERDGSILHIGEQVLEDACQFLAKHVLSNPSMGIRTIQVNVSMVQCLRKNLVETIVPIIQRYHIPPSMITLEITENTAVSTPELMLRHMKALGDMGVKFAMDDYGSGNSNCTYLIQFPFEEIKIDKQIVWAAFDNPTARVVLENEIRTISGLGRSIVVEGIETEEQSEAMKQLGVSYIQGYYYGRPMPPRECLRHIRQFNVEPENYAK